MKHGVKLSRHKDQGGGDCTVKKTMTLALALSFAALLAMVPDVDAKGKGNDDVPQPPECQVEDGGVLVCH